MERDLTVHHEPGNEQVRTFVVVREPEERHRDEDDRHEDGQQPVDDDGARLVQVSWRHQIDPLPGKCLDRSYFSRVSVWTAAGRRMALRSLVRRRGERLSFLDDVGGDHLRPFIARACVVDRAGWNLVGIAGLERQECFACRKEFQVPAFAAKGPAEQQLRTALFESNPKWSSPSVSANRRRPLGRQGARHCLKLGNDELKQSFLISVPASRHSVKKRMRQPIMREANPQPVFLYNIDDRAICRAPAAS